MHHERRQVGSRDEVIEALEDASASLAQTLEKRLPDYERRPGLMRGIRTPSNEALRLYQKAAENSFVGNITEAISFYEGSIEYDPEFATSHYVLSLLYSQRGQMSLARSHALRAWESRAREEGHHEQAAVDMDYYGSVLFDLDDAIRVGRLHIQRDPGHIYRYADLAHWLRRAGQLEEALTAKPVSYTHLRAHET